MQSGQPRTASSLQQLMNFFKRHFQLNRCSIPELKQINNEIIFTFCITFLVCVHW